MKLHTLPPKTHRIEVSLSEEELNFCLNEMAKTSFKLPTQYLRSLLLSRIQWRSENESDQKFEPILQKIERSLEHLQRSNSQFETAFKELIRSSGVLKGFAVGDVNTHPKPTADRIFGIMEKVRSDHELKAKNIFSSTQNEGSVK
jgi:hypothetical protein